jgi:hypothetical protein
MYKYNIMKVELLRLTSVSMPHPYPRVSRRFELIYTLQGIKSDNTIHVSHEGTTSGHSSQRDQGDDSGPPHPSARLPRNTLMGIRRGPCNIPSYIH